MILTIIDFNKFWDYFVYSNNSFFFFKIICMLYNCLVDHYFVLKSIRIFSSQLNLINVNVTTIQLQIYKNIKSDCLNK